MPISELGAAMPLAKHPRGITGDNSNTRTGGATVHMSEEAAVDFFRDVGISESAKRLQQSLVPRLGSFPQKSLMSGENFSYFF